MSLAAGIGQGGISGKMDWRERTYYWVRLNYNSRPLIYKDWDFCGRHYERRVKELKKIPGLRMHPLPSMALAREEREKVPEWAQMLVSCRRAHDKTLVNYLESFKAERYGNCEWERVVEPVKTWLTRDRRGMKSEIQKLKVWDKVRILDGSGIDGYAGHWVSQMKQYVGIISEVTELFELAVWPGRMCVKLTFDNGLYTWDARGLELVEEAEETAHEATEAETAAVPVAEVENTVKEFKIRNSAGVLTVKAERELSLRDVFLCMGDDKLPEMKRPRLELHKSEHVGGWIVTLSDRGCEGTMYVLEFSDSGDGVKAYLGEYDVEVPDKSYVTMEDWKK